MSLIRFKNQTEYAFIIWMSSFPDSFHPSDMQRFYVFVKTVARYRNKKWRNYEFFKQQILLRKPHFVEEDIDKLYDIMMKLLEFYRTPYIDSTNHSEDGKYGYGQAGVKGGELYLVNITEDEFLKDGRKV